MSEQDPSREYQHESIQAIRRYYSDINQTVSDRKQAFMAFGRLIDNLPFQFKHSIDHIWREEPLRIDSWIDDSITRIYPPFDEELRDNPRIAKEKLCLLPFEYIGRNLERSDCSTDIIQEWYDVALRGTNATLQIAHDNSHGHGKQKLPYLMCDHSAICPQRYLELYFGGEAMTPAFSNIDYLKDPYRTRIITTEKVELGIKHDIFLPLDGEALKSQYEQKFDEWFDERPKYQE